MKGLILIPIVFISSFAFGQFKLYEQGVDAYNNKDYGKAISSLNEYMDKSTRDKALDGEVHYILALSYFKSNSFTSSVREFDEALQAGHKNTGNIHWFMAKGYAELKAYKESVAEYDTALLLITGDTNKAKLLFEQGLVHQKMGNAELAVASLKKARELDKSNPEISRALGNGKDIAMGETKVVVSNYPAASTDSKIKGNRKKTETGKEEESKVAANLNQEKDKAEAKPTPAETKKVDKKVAKIEEEKPSTPVTLPAPAPVVTEPTLADQFKEEKRYALVIGNSSYKYVSPLKNAANDANDMAAELEKSKFEVIKVINGSYDQMREAYKKFYEKLSNGPKDQTVGLFYYAGHGLQNEGENYLVPVEANVQYEDDIPRMGFPVQRVVVANMERSNSRMNIIVLDACRNNPFQSAYRSGSSGLAEVKRAKGSFIAFATAPGSVAADGNGRNGLYTQELLKAMQKPGRTIESVFKDVRQNVMKLSGEKQFTWDQSNIIGDFYFKF
ncbi:MAG: caspase family protein [Flammeovirgaceae bacterium]